MLTFALVVALSVGFLLGSLFTIGFQIAIEIARLGKSAERLQQIEKQAERRKKAQEVDTTTM